MLESGVPTSDFTYEPVPSIDSLFTIDEGYETRILYSPSNDSKVMEIVDEMRIYINASKEG